MIKTFTQNDVIRYFYNETTSAEKQDIQNALLCDSELAEYYQELIDMKCALNKIRKEPSDRVIENILNYSKSFSVRTA